MPTEKAQTAKLTKRTIDAISPPAEGFVRIWDTETKGFHLRVRANGRKTFELKYRVGHRQVTMTIGDFGTFTAEEAREAANEAKRAVRLGADPLAQRQAMRNAITVRELIERYLKEGPTDKPNKRASSWKTDETNLRRHVEPLLGTKAARDLTAADLARWQKDVAAGKTAKITKTKKRGRSIIRGGRGAAIRAMRSLSGMLSWAASASHGIIPNNPTANVVKMQDGKRERFLTPDEAAKLWETVANLETADGEQPAALRADHADLFRLLALTGARRGEILGLRWEEIDWARSIVTLTPDRHKAGGKGRGRVIALNQPAIDALRRRQRDVLPRFAKLKKPVPWVFPKLDGSGPIEPPKNAWLKVRKAADLSDLRIHDLRHTYASLLLAKGTPLALVGKALGHTKAATTERYAHLRDEATQSGAAHVATVYSSEPPREVESA